MLGIVPPLGGSPGGGRSSIPSPRVAAIERLRALVGSRGRVGVVPPPLEPVTVAAVAPGHLSTGIAGLDDWLHGWPQHGPVELVGQAGSGRLALVIPLLERLTCQGRSVVLVDPMHQVHPPGLGRVDLARLVLVRPPGERVAWAAEQVARSGAVDVLVVVDAPPFGRGGVRLARAAEAGGMAVFVLSERPEVELPASLRLESVGWQGGQVRVRCTRSRDGRMIGERLIAPSEAPTTETPGARPPVGIVRRRRIGAG
ncbi:MAG: hypothetical protein Q8P41_20930 [Pseudomonadota bacterium]|nr:hypothetical protein [Pseudomonadota bacterium]